MHGKDSKMRSKKTVKQSPCNDEHQPPTGATCTIITEAGYSHTFVNVQKIILDHVVIKRGYRTRLLKAYAGK